MKNAIRTLFAVLVLAATVFVSFEAQSFQADETTQFVFAQDGGDISAANLSNGVEVSFLVLEIEPISKDNRVATLAANVEAFRVVSRGNYEIRSSVNLLDDTNYETHNRGSPV